MRRRCQRWLTTFKNRNPVLEAVDNCGNVSRSYLLLAIPRWWCSTRTSRKSVATRSAEPRRPGCSGALRVTSSFALPRVCRLLRVKEWMLPSLLPWAALCATPHRVPVRACDGISRTACDGAEQLRTCWACETRRARKPFVEGSQSVLLVLADMATSRGRGVAG